MSQHLSAMKSKYQTIVFVSGKDWQIPSLSLILLPKEHSFTLMILEHYHKGFYTAGPTAFLSLVRQKYWPVDGNNGCKLVIRACVVCSRAKELTQHPLMNNFPHDRLSPSFAFCLVGINYAGPILIKERKVINTKLVKAYLSPKTWSQILQKVLF